MSLINRLKILIRVWLNGEVDLNKAIRVDEPQEGSYSEKLRELLFQSRGDVPLCATIYRFRDKQPFSVDYRIAWRLTKNGARPVEFVDISHLGHSQILLKDFIRGRDFEQET